MNSQIEDIYRDVLVNGDKIFVSKQYGNKFHIVTYFPYPFLMEFIKNHGYDLELMLEQTSYKDYILQDE